MVKNACPKCNFKKEKSLWDHVMCPIPKLFHKNQKSRLFYTIMEMFSRLQEGTSLPPPFTHPCAL